MPTIVPSLLRVAWLAAIVTSYMTLPNCSEPPHKPKATRAPAHLTTGSLEELRAIWVQNFVVQLAGDNACDAQMAFLTLFCLGKEAIPFLLKEGANTQKASFALPEPQLLSIAPINSPEGRPTVGTLCLYLIESIRRGKLLHSQCPAYASNPHKPPDPKWFEPQMKAKALYEQWYGSGMQQSNATDALSNLWYSGGMSGEESDAFLQETLRRCKCKER